MPDTLVATEDFEDYEDNIALGVRWGGGLLSAGTPATPDGVQCVALGLDTGAGGPDPWGTNQNLISAVFDGLVPDGQYRIRYKMQIGGSRSSVVGGFPSPHTFTAGLQANDERSLIAVVDEHAPEGTRDDADIPGDAEVFEYPGVNVSGDPISDEALFPELDGWKDYSLLTQADGDGEIEITLGTFDARYFQANTFFDKIEIYLVSAPAPATPGVRRAVLYFCETVGNRIIAYGEGITQIGDNYQGEVETHDLIPSTETGSNFFRSVNVALHATGAHTIGITPIVDGKELPEQIFSGAGDGETAYEAFIGQRGVRIRARVRTIERGGPIELETITVVVVPVRKFP